VKAEKVPEQMACTYLKDINKTRQLKQLCEQLYHTLDQAEKDRA
jgi:hypothetical protein